MSRQGTAWVPSTRLLARTHWVLGLLVEATAPCVFLRTRSPADVTLCGGQQVNGGYKVCSVCVGGGGLPTAGMRCADQKQTNEGPTGWYQSIYTVSATRTRDSFI